MRRIKVLKYHFNIFKLSDKTFFGPTLCICFIVSTFFSANKLLFHSVFKYLSFHDFPGRKDIYDILVVIIILYVFAQF